MALWLRRHDELSGGAAAAAFIMRSEGVVFDPICGCLLIAPGSAGAAAGGVSPRVALPGMPVSLPGLNRKADESGGRRRAC